MQGWEGLLGGTPECNQTAWNGVREEVLDLVTNDVGLNRVKLPLRSGYEDSTDHFSRYMRGETTFDQWKYTWFRPVNDDADPRHREPGRIPVGLSRPRRRDAAPAHEGIACRRVGDDLWVSLAYVGGRNTVHEGDPEEYAELVEQVFVHLRDRYGLVPQSIEVINEPNMHDAWTPAQVARALLAARARLAAIGITPQFIGPSTSTMQAAERFLDGMLAVPGAREALTDFSYHRYGGNLAVLAAHSRARRLVGYRTAMNERIGADKDTLYQDLTVGHVSSWQQFAVVFCPPPERGDGGGIYVRFTTEDTLHPTARLTPMARYLRQYFRYVRFGAHRIEADASDDGVRVTAFVNPDGGAVVVVDGDRARTLEIRGLPAGRYGDVVHHPGRGRRAGRRRDRQGRDPQWCSHRCRARGRYHDRFRWRRPRAAPGTWRSDRVRPVSDLHAGTGTSSASRRGAVARPSGGSCCWRLGRARRWPSRCRGRGRRIRTCSRRGSSRGPSHRDSGHRLAVAAGGVGRAWGVASRLGMAEAYRTRALAHCGGGGAGGAECGRVARPAPSGRRSRAGDDLPVAGRRNGVAPRQGDGCGCHRARRGAHHTLARRE